MESFHWSSPDVPGCVACLMPRVRCELKPLSAYAALLSTVCSGCGAGSSIVVDADTWGERPCYTLSVVPPGDVTLAAYTLRREIEPLRELARAALVRGLRCHGVALSSLTAAQAFAACDALQAAGLASDVKPHWLPSARPNTRRPKSPRRVSRRIAAAGLIELGPLWGDPEFLYRLAADGHTRPCVELYWHARGWFCGDAHASADGVDGRWRAYEVFDGALADAVERLLA